jgi:hypothetical protein
MIPFPRWLVEGPVLYWCHHSCPTTLHAHRVPRRAPFNGTRPNNMPHRATHSTAFLRGPIATSWRRCGPCRSPHPRPRPPHRRTVRVLTFIQSGEQPHGLAVPAHDQPIAVVFDLVHPVGPGRRLGCNGGNARVDKLISANAACEHQDQIAARHRPVESSECRGTALGGRR